VWARQAAAVGAAAGRPWESRGRPVWAQPAAPGGYTQPVSAGGDNNYIIIIIIIK
jgi:hypothetical protein